MRQWRRETGVESLRPWQGVTASPWQMPARAVPPECAQETSPTSVGDGYLARGLDGGLNRGLSTRGAAGATFAPWRGVAGPGETVPAPEIRSPFAQVTVGPSDEQVRRDSIRRPSEPDQEFIIAGPQTDLDPHMRKHGLGLGILASLVLAAGIMGAPTTARAADVAAPVSVSTTVASSSNLAELKGLASSLGMQAETLQKVAGRSGVVDTLQGLPPGTREMYRTLDLKYKQQMVEKLQGTSGFLFVRVSNRDAFVNGKAAGVNTFDHMQEKLKEAVQDGKVSSDMGGRLGGVIEQFRTMTSTQREALVSLMEADVLGR